jgi:hypothetical protein
MLCTSNFADLFGGRVLADSDSAYKQNRIQSQFANHAPQFFELFEIVMPRFFIINWKATATISVEMKLIIFFLSGV